MRNEYLRELLALVEKWNCQITKLEIVGSVLQLSIWPPDDPWKFRRNPEGDNQDKRSE
jgi:hypothetical protein